MSTDITLEAAPTRAPVNFDDFVRDDLDALARAIALVAPNELAAANVLHDAVETAYSRWKEIGFDTKPPRFVFGHAVSDIAAASDTPEEVVGSAVVVAHHGLSWSADQITSTFDLTAERVATLLTDAEITHISDQAQSGDRDEPTIDLATHIRSELATAPFLLPDIDAIKQASRSSTRRKRIAIAVVGLAGLVFAASFVANTGSSTPVAEPVPTIQAVPIEIERVEGAEADGEPLAGVIGNEPRPDLVPFPELITTDGDGGFVGVRSPSPQNRQIVFTRSEGGDTWALASRWNLGAQVRVARLERSGDHYVVWLENTPQTSPAVIGTIAVSTDLIGWTVLELATSDTTPRGLSYEQQLRDVSVSADSILALVTTTVEIDFAALSMSEGYTCGRTITDDEVSINLCNGGELDVLSLSGIAQLPDRNRLFVSRNGRQFESVTAPFGSETAARLTAVNGAFAVTDEAGVRFATSTDADTWQTVTAGKPPFAVRAAASDDGGLLVGLGTGTDGLPVLFRSDSRTSTTLPLRDVVADTTLDPNAVVAAGPLGWVIYLFEPFTNAWLLTSADGTSWDVIPSSPPVGDNPQLLVGDDEVLIQWVDSDNQTITLGVPIP